MQSNQKTLQIKKNESLSSLERKILEVSQDKGMKLRVPSKLDTRGILGVEVALIQLIFTWLSENNENSTFHSYSSSKADFSALCNSMYGILLLTLPQTILDDSKLVVNRREALSGAVDSMNQLKNRVYKNIFPPQYFGVPCIRKRNYRREFDMPLYSGRTEEVIESGEFETFFTKVLSGAVLKTQGKGANLMKIGIGAISEIFWELFKNTHDHGRKDTYGNILKNNFRGFIWQRQHVTEKYLDGWCGDTGSESQVAFRNSLLSHKSARPGILDMSVFDMGEGIVPLSKTKSGKTDDEDVLLWCLEKGNSRLHRPSGGAGFNKVIDKVIDHGGWLRIRTGNLILEKVFVEGCSVAISRGDVSRTDSFAKGTTVHISIPLASGT